VVVRVHTLEDSGLDDDMAIKMTELTDTRCSAQLLESLLNIHDCDFEGGFFESVEEEENG
jgi:hypothetical protein